MADQLAAALELDAPAVAAAPIVGYRIDQVSAPGDGSSSQTARRLQVSQPWIEKENSPVTIDTGLFAVCQPLGWLFASGPTASGVFAPISDALADFGCRWALSSELRARANSCASSGLVLFAGDAEALVWREGIAIGAYEPLETALRLLMAGFSEQARRAHVYAQPTLLQTALRLLPEHVKSLYVPEAQDYIDQAERERHERVLLKQAWIKAQAKWVIGPDGVTLIRVLRKPGGKRDDAS